MKIKTCGNRCVIMAVLALLLIGSSGYANNVITFTDGRRMRFDAIRYQARTDEYIVTADRGQFPFAAHLVQDIQMAQPERWDQGVRLLRGGRHDDAINVFRSIISDYNRLGWDNRARLMLAQAYSAKGDHSRAVSQYEAAFEHLTPSAAQRMGYWNALLAAERFSALRTELDRTIATAEREGAARAHLMRGNMHAAEGNTMEALFDYLRIHILYEQVTEIQPEALYRAAERLDALRDPRAAELRQRLRERYPRSEFAQRAR